MRDNAREFEEAFERYSDELFRHACLRLSDRERALELTQETFLRTWGYVQKHEEDIREFRPFLYRTLRNLIIDEYRRRKTVSLDAMMEDEDGGVIESLMPADDTNTLERAMERLDGKDALKQLAKLSDPYKEALTLRFVESLSLKEIAEICGESENVVSVRIHRGLHKLRALLEPNV